MNRLFRALRGNNLNKQNVDRGTMSGSESDRLSNADFRGHNEGMHGSTGSGMNIDSDQMQELTRLRSAIKNTMTAIMMIDRELNVTYVNEATQALLRKHEPVLRNLWPSFQADRVVGACIDMFHKNPSHQRRLLSDPANLPHSADIHVGPLTFNINVTAQVDAVGNYIGNTLEWYDVTEQRAQETEVARLRSAVDSANANLMLCDEDLNITYVNTAVKTMLKSRESVLQQVFPGFNAGKLVGQNIDQFHKNPQHQRSLLKDVSRLPARAQIKVADVEFEVNATAILGPNGEYMGNMVEWKDITEQKDAERQMQNLIAAATKGDLAQRLQSSRYEGFMRGLAEGINRMLDTLVEPLREGTRVMGYVSRGDLTSSMQGAFEGEFAVLQEAINSSVENLRNMVEQIRDAAASMGTSVSEISQGNQDLSQRTEQQASSIEETAATMDELTGTVKQNAENANTANQLASTARNQAEKGGAVVQTAIKAMGEINSSSKKIADIIGVIDEIAFQTNLLALNAAVEAARAGEQGRGFAVVASEVRNLAQRSAGAAKEIKALINDSVYKVEEGSKLINESGATLQEIVASVKKVSDIIAEIASASVEQSTGIEQVNKAVALMDKAVQQNAALVEEAAAASESMDEQGRQLVGLMEFFDSGKASDSVATRSPAANVSAMAKRSSRPAEQPSRAPALKRTVAGGSSNNSSNWDQF